LKTKVAGFRLDGISRRPFYRSSKKQTRGKERQVTVD